MRRLQCALLATAAVIGFASIASAADMPVKARPMAPAVYNWTGFYVGVNGGYAWGHTTGSFLAGPPDFNYDISGGLFGGQIGYNYQIANWVLGVEADYDWANIKGSVSPVAGVTIDSRTKSFGTARARLGYAWDSALLYGTGGWLFGANTTATVTVLGVSVSDSHNLNGWVLGGGLEYGLTPNWSAKAEYLYARANEQDFFTGPPVGCVVNCANGARFNIIRAGLNYRFN